MVTNPSGTIAVEGDTIVFASPPNSWRLEVADLVALGEYTTPDGPYLEDYWLVFLSPTGYKLAPFYATGCESFLDWLRQRLGHNFRCHLAGSTDYASNVLWPSSIAGQPFFDFNECHPKSIGEHIKRVFSGRTFIMQLSEKILALLPNEARVAPVPITNTETMDAS